MLSVQRCGPHVHHPAGPDAVSAGCRLARNRFPLVRPAQARQIPSGSANASSACAGGAVLLHRAGRQSLGQPWRTLACSAAQSLLQQAAGVLRAPGLLLRRCRRGVLALGRGNGHEGDTQRCLKRWHRARSVVRRMGHQRGAPPPLVTWTGAGAPASLQIGNDATAGLGCWSRSWPRCWNTSTSGGSQAGSKCAWVPTAPARARRCVSGGCRCATGAACSSSLDAFRRSRWQLAQDSGGGNGPLHSALQRAARSGSCWYWEATTGLHRGGLAWRAGPICGAPADARLALAFGHRTQKQPMPRGPPGGDAPPGPPAGPALSSCSSSQMRASFCCGVPRWAMTRPMSRANSTTPFP